MQLDSLGLLIMRLGFGGVMLIRHGLPKLLNFGQKMHSFPDPLGIGSVLSLSLTVSAEFLCAFALIIGLFTRMAALPLVITMSVAFFIVHNGDPFAKRELTFMFLMGFSAIMCAGPGQYSADSIFRNIR